MSPILYLLSTWLHVLAASVWLGSIAFLALVLVPALRGTEPSTRRELLRSSGYRLRSVAWAAFVVLTATGVLQLGYRGFRLADVGGSLWIGPFGHALAGKLICFAITLVLSWWHDFRVGPKSLTLTPGSPEAEAQRRLASRLGRAVFLLGLLIFFFAVSMVRPT